MRGIERNVARSLATWAVTVLCTTFLAVSGVSAQSTIKSTICADSRITITQPPKDGTVNNALVHFSGTIANAGQIEVYVDDMYNSQIPVPDNATTYESDITIAKGTHTIKLVAIAHCSESSNASSALVVTYVPAATSGPTSTNVSEDGSNIQSGGTPQTQQPLSPSLNNTFQSIAQWLNFKTDNQQEGQSRLSVIRAVTLGAGLALAVFGMASLIVDWFSRATAGFLLPGVTGGRRITMFRVFFRVVGGVVVLLSLFVS